MARTREQRAMKPTRRRKKAADPTPPVAEPISDAAAMAGPVAVVLDPLRTAAPATQHVVPAAHTNGNGNGNGHNGVYGREHDDEDDERPDQVMALLDERIRSDPDSVELLIRRGALLGRQLRLREAEADFRRALQLEPSHGEALLDLGLTLWRRGNAAKAAEMLDRAAAHQPQNPTAFNYLAEALHQTGQAESAVVALERSLALDPDQPRAYHLMGRVLDRLRRPEEARQAYRRGQELSRQ
jgi:predicted Zn-dependent protease